MDVRERAKSIAKELANDPVLGNYLDVEPDLPIPAPVRGGGHIRLMILGQDPTVSSHRRRRDVKTVLDVRSREGPLRTYLSFLCAALGLVMEENAYVTNLVKGFFRVPPAQLRDVDLIALSVPHWLPLLQEELAEFPGVSVLTLGQPVLSALLNPGVRPQVRDYWGYTPEWERGRMGELGVVEPEDNVLGRVLIPFPHINTARKHRFYLARWGKYTSFAKEWV